VTGFRSVNNCTGERVLNQLEAGNLIDAAIWPQQIRAENWGEGCAPLWEGQVGFHLTQCGQGRGLPARQVSS